MSSNDDEAWQKGECKQIVNYTWIMSSSVPFNLLAHCIRFLHLLVFLYCWHYRTDTLRKETKILIESAAEKKTIKRRKELKFYEHTKFDAYGKIPFFTPNRALKILSHGAYQWKKRTLKMCPPQKGCHACIFSNMSLSLNDPVGVFDFMNAKHFL